MLHHSLVVALDNHMSSDALAQALVW